MGLQSILLLPFIIIFVSVGFLMNFAQALAFVFVRPFSQSLFRQLAHVSQNQKNMFYKGNILLIFEVEVGG